MFMTIPDNTIEICPKCGGTVFTTCLTSNPPKYLKCCSQCDWEEDVTVYVNDNDVVNHPKHYTGGKVECIDAMESVFGIEAVKSFCLCNAFKYHWRHADKNGEEDLQKATWYMDKYKELVNR